MTREEAVELLVNATYSDEWQGNNDLQTAHNMAMEALKQEPGWIPVSERLPEDLEPNTEQFAKWVASEIFDDDWEYNKDTFAEIACRKLAKLGIVKVNGDEWELVKSQESEE